MLVALDKPAKVIVERVGFSCTLLLVSAEEGIALHFGVNMSPFDSKCQLD